MNYFTYVLTKNTAKFGYEIEEIAGNILKF